MGNKNVSEIIKQGEKRKVDISQIRVPEYHDRTDVDDENIESLANNMSEVGQLNPILLDKKGDDNFELISGLRRYEAALKLNWSDIDAIVFENLDEENRILVMITENAQRVDLNDYDLIKSLVHYVSIITHKLDDEIISFIYKLRNLDSGNVKGLTFDEKKLKKSIEDCMDKTDKYTLKTLMSKIKVLNFNPEIIKAMQDHKLLFSYAFQLNKIKDELVINEILHKFITKQIGKDELKKEIRKYLVLETPNQVTPFYETLKKLKDFKSLSEDIQSIVISKMQEIEDILAS